MHITLDIDARAEAAADILLALSPPVSLAGWDVANLYVVPSAVGGTAITLSILASLCQPADADAALASVQVRERGAQRCRLAIRSDGATEPERALVAWLLDEARRAWPEIEPQLDTLARKARVKGNVRGTSSVTDANAREAARLYSEGLTEEAIAERMAVSVRTVKRWRKRARDLPKTM